MSSRAGQLIVIIGVMLVLVGLATMRGWFGWFGSLPGDVRVERENVRLYAPIVSMLLLSVLLSLVAYVVRRFL